MSAISRRHFIGSAAAASAIPLIGSSAHAQADWPTKPIRIVAGYPAGGRPICLRAPTANISGPTTGQNVVVENKAGASGSVAAVEVKRAAPDGYTLMFTISTTMIMNSSDIPTSKDHVSIMAASVVAANRRCRICRLRRRQIRTYRRRSRHMAIVEMNRIA